MIFKYLQLRVQISVMAFGLDSFEMVDWVPLPASDRENAISNGAGSLTQTATALLWECISCAAPNVHDVLLNMQVESFTHSAIYTNAVTPAGTDYTGWSPDLHDLVTDKAKEINADLTAMFTDLAAAHFDGAAIEGGSRYVIRPRH